MIRSRLLALAASVTLFGACALPAFAQQSISQSGAPAPAGGPATSAGAGTIVSGGASATSQPGTPSAAPVTHHRRHHVRHMAHKAKPMPADTSATTPAPTAPAAPAPAATTPPAAPK